MTFAYINEAWGANTNEMKKKKKNVPACDTYRRIPKEPVLSKQAVIDQDQVYHVQPNDIYEKDVQFVEYDDFYKSDFQFSSKIDQDKSPDPPVYHPPPVQEQSYEPRIPVYENFASNTPTNCNLEKEQMYLEFIMYVVCGIFMILILEQVLQLGTKFIN